MNEQWKTIPEFPCYSVSSDGRVRRDIAGRNNFSKAGRILTPQRAANGYLFVNLYGESGVSRVSVHRLVCFAFLGFPPSPVHEVGHIDGSRDNNCAQNLKWCTRKENHADKKIHGTAQIGERNGNSRLSDQDAKKIFEEDGTQVGLAKKYRVSQATIWRIKNRMRAAAK